MNLCRKNHIRSVEQNIIVNSNGFWSFVKKSKSNTVGFPCSMFLGDIIADSSKSIADLFATYFQTVYTVADTDVNMSSSNWKDNLVDINSFEISTDLVLSKLLSLDSSVKIGPDGIPSLFLKQCAQNLCFPLQILCERYLQLLSKVPTLWKISYVTPIYKKGHRSDISNYRPISIGSPIAKIFDSITCDILSFHVKNIILDEQHGFFKGRSTTSNLMIFTNYIVNNMENGYDTDCIYTDLAKAFDRVNIRILLLKLAKIGIGDPLLSWIDSYLSNRRQFVIINSYFVRVSIAC